ncbi:Zn(II)2Cys6 transcription factor [Aspergillus brunneoviolaceus CBS 621.78]|uniref:Uncharacterized protein n=1 Tax=Aspergillus brunneoviolaceus CBS 621.78 TaxID=1450534 RepID=A0ACD1GN42_9EURO|nr:hypothetical protein BO95DRAFT_438465 [Aspergillus brunneoviolaceus CBS 621.78]RAH50698.1 hypothetical protein BO95DRAFT_438465 [Aspergillus brunneoviolaceus CBS 621.78]
MHAGHRAPSRAACLACRARKIRCDGRSPCSRCSYKGLNCVYRPSRRGGIRRGGAPKSPVTEAPAPVHNPTFPPLHNPQHAFAAPASTQVTGDEEYLASIFNLLDPLGGIRNLDVDGIDGSRYDAWSGVPAAAAPDNNVCDPMGDVMGTSSLVPLRAYTSDEDIVNAYYVHIHPFLPILPPPLTTNRIEDRPSAIQVPQGQVRTIQESSFPHWPASVLTLAISAILVSIPLPSDSEPSLESSITLRRFAAQQFAEAAFRAVDNEIDAIPRTPPYTTNFAGAATGDNDISPVSSVLALILLSIHEYCQRGNVSRMRRRANQAITAAMDLRLHSLGAAATEAQRRAWWGAMFVLYLSSIDQDVVPIITLDDQRITTPYPAIHNHSELWPLLLQAETAILSVSHTLHNRHSPPALAAASPPQINAEITQLDSTILEITRKLDRSPRPESRTHVEEQALLTAWAIARSLAYSARVRLHRSRAFSNIPPIFIHKHCDLPSHHDPTRPPHSTPEDRILAAAAFPFTEAQSSLIRLKASLAMARAYERITAIATGGAVHRGAPYPQPTGASHASSAERFGLPTPARVPPRTHIIPFFLCGAMQASYILLMTYHQLRAALWSTGEDPRVSLSKYVHLLPHPVEPGSEIQDVERLLREIQQGVDLILGVMRLTVMFEEVGGMAAEVQSAYYSLSGGEL